MTPRQANAPDELLELEELLLELEELLELLELLELEELLEELELELELDELVELELEELELVDELDDEELLDDDEPTVGSTPPHATRAVANNVVTANCIIFIVIIPLFGRCPLLL